MRPVTSPRAAIPIPVTPTVESTHHRHPAAYTTSRISSPSSPLPTTTRSTTTKTGSRLLALPSELLTEIALIVALLDTPLGPPKYLLPLLCTCRALHDLCTSHTLLALVFRNKFDSSAVKRRLRRSGYTNPHHYPHHYSHSPTTLPPSYFSTQLKRNCHTLSLLKTPQTIYLPRPTLLPILWNVFIMLLENDGRNYVQLVRWAGVRRWIDALVRERLWEGRDGDGFEAAGDAGEEGWGKSRGGVGANGDAGRGGNGWPRDSMFNALALWILWMVEDEDTLRNETPEQRHEMITLVLPFVYAGFRYPAFHVSDIHFKKIPVINATSTTTAGGLGSGQSTSISLPQQPQLEMPRTVQTAHGDYPLYPPINPYSHLHSYPYSSSYHDAATSSTYPSPTTFLANPLAPLAAELIYFSRRSSVFSPLYAPVGIPRDRSSVSGGSSNVGTGTDGGGNPYVGPTVWDYDRFNEARGVGGGVRSLVESGTNASEGVEAGDEGRAEDGWETTMWDSSLNLNSTSKTEPSRVWDTFWERLSGCWDPWVGVRGRGVGGLGGGVSTSLGGELGDGGGFGSGSGGKFTRGSLEGLWVGRMLIPDESSYFTSIATPNLSQFFSEMQPFMAVRPVYMRLREYWVRCPGEEVLAGGVSGGVTSTGRVSRTGRGRSSGAHRNTGSGGNEGVPTTPLEIFDEGVRNGWLRPDVEVWEDVGYEKAFVRDGGKVWEYERRGRRPSSGLGLGGLGDEGEDEDESEGTRKKRRRGGRCRVCGDVERGGPVGVGVIESHAYDEDMEFEDAYEDEDGDVGMDVDMDVDPDADADADLYEDEDEDEYGEGDEYEDDDEDPEDDEDKDEDMLEDEDDEEIYNSYKSYEAEIQAELSRGSSSSRPHSHSYPYSQQHSQHQPQQKGKQRAEYVDVDHGDYGDEDENGEEGRAGCGAYRDVLIVGQTDKTHGEAWGNFKFYGRMRSWDGLVAIVAVPANPTQAYLGKWIFRGYVMADKMLVGRWRLQDYDVDVPPYEGAFVIRRQDE